MQFKVIGDGSASGMQVVDKDSGAELRGLKDVRLDVASTAITTLVISNISLFIDPQNAYDPRNYLMSPGPCTEFWLKLVGDGTDSGTAVLNDQTNERLEDVVRIIWEWDDAHDEYVLYLEVEDVTYEIQPKIKPAASSSPSSGATTSSTGSTYGYSPTPSPSYMTPTMGGSSGSPMGTGGAYNPQTYSNCPSMPSSGTPPYSSKNKDADPLLPFDQDQPADPSTCQHEWINASFTGIKMVCKHCNIDKP